jgi:Flp pilus assembly secretin CpaC
MRYHLSLLAAILASTPVCAAEFTDTIKIPPGFTERWQAPRPFTDIMIGNPDIVDAKPETNQALMISMKDGAEGGVTNIVLLDEHGDQVANVLVTSPREPSAVTPTFHRQMAWSTKTGAWQVYQKDDECYRFCVSIETKPNDPAPSNVVETKPNDPAPSNVVETKANDPAPSNVVISLNKSKTFRLDQPFSTAIVGSPEIADALPMSDRSLYIRGKKIGSTDVSVFDTSMRLLDVLDVQIAP